MKVRTCSHEAQKYALSVHGFLCIESWETKPYEVAKRLVALILFPYLKKRYGKGIMATVKKASREEAQW
jgi:hypothetical protein